MFIDKNAYYKKIIRNGYVPYESWEDFKDIKDMRVVNITCPGFETVLEVCRGVFTDYGKSIDSSISFQNFLRLYTWMDGSPCGKLKED